MNDSIPDNLQTDIQKFTDALSSSLDDALRSVVLYDGMAKNEFIKDTDHVSIMIVLTEVTPTNLDRVSAALDASGRPRQFQPMVVSEADLKSSTDIFPIKFLDMQQDYDVIAGDDVVKDLKIGRDHLRLRCEQEIKSLMLRLRTVYLNATDEVESMEGALLRGYYRFLKAGDALAELKTGKVCHTEAEIATALGEIGLDADLLQKIAGLRQGEGLGDAAATKEAFVQFMAMVDQAARMADEL